MFWRKFASAVAIAALATGCSANEGEREADAIEEGSSKPVAENSDSAPAPEVASNAMTCTYPVRAGDTVRSLMQRYGEDARLETLDGPEGMEIPGVVLWGNDPKRRVDVGFEDEARTKMTTADVYDKSAWTLGTIKVGDTLARLRSVNGKPITFLGFEWDYGGWVMDLGGGALGKLDGGCTAVFGLTYDYEKWKAPLSIVGDVEVSSDSADVNAKMITVYAMGIGFPR